MREKKYADYLCYLEMESIVSENFFSDFDTAKYSHGKRSIEEEERSVFCSNIWETVMIKNWSGFASSFSSD